jgi:hypothetical protein
VPYDHHFDRLIAWAELSDTELGNQFSDESAEILRWISSELGSAEERSTTVTRENFTAVVRAMRQRYHVGSRALGTAIIEAARFAEDGKIAEAQGVFRRFTDNCPSEFYRQIALSELRRLSQARPKSS